MKEIIEITRPQGDTSKIIIGEVLQDLEQYLPDKRVIIITDANLHRHYRDLIERYEHIIIGMGETNKTFLTIDKIYKELIGMNADRETFILGFGGGIVTDITGFAASTYMRGVSFGFIASTLLAQIDASVGGKNGINIDGYKNMAGTFNQPDFVICDTSILKTLPKKEFSAGLAEIIKAGIIADSKLFGLFENNTAADFRENGELLLQTISMAVKVKAGIVERDEKEHGERRKLNLGHTFAHAIEKTTSSFSHGEAVAIGLAIISDLAVKMGMLPDGDAVRIKNVLTAAELPTDSGIDIKRLLKALRLDKKRDTDSINLAIPTGIGSCGIKKLSFSELDSFFL